MNLFENENKVKGTFLAINNIKRFKFVQIMFDSISKVAKLILAIKLKNESKWETI